MDGWMDGWWIGGGWMDGGWRSWNDGGWWMDGDGPWWMEEDDGWRRMMDGGWWLDWWKDGWSMEPGGGPVGGEDGWWMDWRMEDGTTKPFHFFFLPKNNKQCRMVSKREVYIKIIRDGWMGPFTRYYYLQFRHVSAMDYVTGLVHPSIPSSGGRGSKAADRQ
jgi:hypothetical protein